MTDQNILYNDGISEDQHCNRQFYTRQFRTACIMMEQVKISIVTDSYIHDSSEHPV
jgi:hypothetical protein